MTPRRQNSAPALAEDSVAAQAEKTPARVEAGSSKRHFYKRLPKEFRRAGFSYRQIAREDDVAIYEQTLLSCAEASRSYEVIRIRRRDAFQIGGRLVEPAEVYPASDLWGVDGFTFTNRNKAWAKFFEMSLEEPERTGKEVNLKWENPSESSSATLST